MIQVPHAIRDSLESLQIPSIPQVLLRFLSLAESDTTSTNTLAELVSQDPALSARVLTVANSVALRRGKPTTSLSRCMVILGTRLSRTLAACLVIQNAFSGVSVADRYDLTGFWLHSLRVADLCRTIAEHHHYPAPEEAYMAGLLHDIGQLLLLGGIEEHYTTLLTMSRDENTLQMHEEQRLNTDHAMIGAWLIDRWGISSSCMTDAVLFHHTSAEEIKDADPLSRIVWIAHMICQYQRFYQTEQTPPHPEFTVSQQLFGIDYPQAAELYRKTAERVSMIAEALGIICADDKRTMPVCRMPIDSLALHLQDTEPLLSASEEAVRNMALLKPLQQGIESVQNEGELYLAAQESARILFGLSSVAFLSLCKERNCLSGIAGSFQPELFQQLCVPLDSGNSLAAACTDGTPRCTLSDEQRTVIALTDRQISRIMVCEELIYLPMIGPSGLLGVMICGVSAFQARRLMRRLSSLVGFAGTAAGSIETWRKLQATAAEREVRITQQLEHHARKLVHEAGNPLGIIKNYLSIMSSKLPEGVAINQELDILKEEIDRVTQILQGMSTLSVSATTGQLIDVNNLIESLLVLYRASLFDSCGIELQLDLEPGLPNIPTDRNNLKQILFNLWNNASDALQPGDQLTVKTSSGYIQDGQQYIKIRISDTGPGLPPDVTPHLFSPLPPNRRSGHAGMGLSIVAELVQQLSGRITCHSTTVSGTSFSILLPIGLQNYDQSI